jgi:cystathionine gamma-synthase/cystathionine gamma-lyase
MYGGTYRILEKVLKKWGLSTTYADVDRIGSFEKAIRKNTRLIWIETPTNPLLKIVDIQKLSRVSRRHKVLLVVDNTFASPYFQRPLSLGADIVVHSTTKYIAGHSDIVGGAVVLNDAKLSSELRYYQNAAGSIPGPWDCWLVLRGLKTLAVRMRTHQENARFLLKYLSRHPKVERVYYPGFSGMLSFQLKGGRREVDAFFAHLKLFALAESLGGVESLISYPAGMTHSSMPHEERLKRGITDNFIRVSVGIENKIDLKADILRALTFV